jgi:hypothetical protein
MRFTATHQRISDLDKDLFWQQSDNLIIRMDCGFLCLFGAAIIDVDDLPILP